MANGIYISIVQHIIHDNYTIQEQLLSNKPIHCKHETKQSGFYNSSKSLSVSFFGLPIGNSTVFIIPDGRITFVGLKTKPALTRKCLKMSNLRCLTYLIHMNVLKYESREFGLTPYVGRKFLQWIQVPSID